MTFADRVKGTVRVDDLNGNYSPRSSVLDLDHAKRLAEVFDDLPRVLVHPDTMKVIDGVHRLHAAKHHLGLAEIEVAWFAGTEDAARDAAVSLNNDHGLPLTLADRGSAARQMVERHPDWSDARIADECGVSRQRVEQLRPEPSDMQPPSKSDTREGRDGVQRPARRGAAADQARDYLTENPDASAREVAREAGVSADTAARVKRTERSTTSTTTDRPALAPVPDTPDGGDVRVDEAVTFIPKWTKDSRFLTDGPVGQFGRWMHKRTAPHPTTGATVDYSTWLEGVDLDACPARDRAVAAQELRRIAGYYRAAADHLSGSATLRSTS